MREREERGKEKGKKKSDRVPLDNENGRRREKIRIKKICSHGVTETTGFWYVLGWQRFSLMSCPIVPFRMVADVMPAGVLKMDGNCGRPIMEKSSYRCFVGQ